MKKKEVRNKELTVKELNETYVKEAELLMSSLYETNVDVLTRWNNFNTKIEEIFFEKTGITVDEYVRLLAEWLANKGDRKELKSIEMKRDFGIII